MRSCWWYWTGSRGSDLARLHCTHADMKPPLTDGALVVIQGHHEPKWNGKMGVVVEKAVGTHFNWIVLVEGQRHLFNEHYLRPL